MHSIITSNSHPSHLSHHSSHRCISYCSVFNVCVYCVSFMLLLYSCFNIQLHDVWLQNAINECILFLFGPELIPDTIQSACIAGDVVLNPVVGCFLQGPQLPSQPESIAFWTVPNTAWWQRGTCVCVNNLPRVITCQHDIWVQSLNHCITKPHCMQCIHYIDMVVFPCAYSG